ncbi:MULTISPECIES: type II toxin-antitoxin system toxin DNA ADP-ribosyl transferase DarT [Micromonospora]
MTNTTMRPTPTRILHFTHIDNLPGIAKTGRLLADSAVGAQLAVNVGAVEIKARRRERQVPCPPGGVVADYVPFYFAPRSPMMFRIACDHRDGKSGCYRGGDDPLIYLVSSVERVHESGRGWAASDGNCAVGLTRFSAELTELDALVDWPLLDAQVWKDVPDDMDRMRRRAAEFLVHREFPVDLLVGYAVRTKDRQEQVRQVFRDAGMIEPYVGVRPSWYYGYARGEVRE